MFDVFSQGLGMLPLLRGGRSRSINWENRFGEKGGACKAASPLGPSRKGSACIDRIQAGDDLEVADFRAALTGDGSVVVRDKTRSFDFRVVAELSAREREIIADGGLLAHVARSRA